MGGAERELDEPLSPAGRLFLRPELNQVINTIIAVENPIDISAVKSEIAKSVMITHPRFSSLMITDPSSGRQTWHKTPVDIDRHVIIVRTPVSDSGDSEEAVNAYVAELSSATCQLGTDKPLWELHFLMAYNCIVFRIHHALGDGVSLMALMLAFCRKADDQNEMPSVGKRANKGVVRARGLSVLWEFVVAIWLTMVFVIKIVLRALWVKDRRTTVTGGAGVEKWPRLLATARFQLEDMKAVKNAIHGAKLSCIWLIRLQAEFLCCWPEKDGSWMKLDFSSTSKKCIYFFKSCNQTSHESHFVLLLTFSTYSSWKGIYPLKIELRYSDILWSLDPHCTILH